MKISISIFTALIALFIFSCSSSSSETNNENPVDSSSVTAIDSPQSPPINPQDFTGTYTYGSQDGEEGGGYLAIKKMPDDSLKFELDINNGAPNYHSGAAAGKMAFVDNIATFITTDFGGQCTITFTLNDGKINVEQVDGNDFTCGFGQGVMADGAFTKINNEAIFNYKGGM